MFLGFIILIVDLVQNGRDEGGGGNGPGGCEDGIFFGVLCRIVGDDGRGYVLGLLDLFDDGVVE